MEKFWMYKIVITIFTLLWMIVIFFFSSESADISREKSQHIRVQVNKIIEQAPVKSGSVPFRLQDFHIRKAAHVLEYIVLGVLLTLLLSGLVRRKAAWAWGVGTLIACADEYSQYFAPGRGPQLRDVVIDSMGVLIGIAGMYAIMLVRQTIENQL